MKVGRVSRVCISQLKFIVSKSTPVNWSIKKVVTPNYLKCQLFNCSTIHFLFFLTSTVWDRVNISCIRRVGDSVCHGAPCAWSKNLTVHREKKTLNQNHFDILQHLNVWTPFSCLRVCVIFWFIKHEYIQKDKHNRYKSENILQSEWCESVKHHEL